MRSFFELVLGGVVWISGSIGLYETSGSTSWSVQATCRKGSFAGCFCSGGWLVALLAYERSVSNSSRVDAEQELPRSTLKDSTCKF